MISEQSESRYAKFSRHDMIPFLPDKYAKVLEIGCNVGNFRQNVSKSCEYWGVEPFKQAANVAKTKMDKILIGFYDDVKDEIPNDYFDLVIANDVIEHLEQPWDFLNSIKEKMTKEASLVLSIPNVRNFYNIKELLYNKDWKYKDTGILDITHLRFFTEKSIIRLLNENGFEIQKINGIHPNIRIRHLPFYYFCKFILGNDIKFLQFGLRVKIK